MQRLIALATHGSVTEEGFIFPEQFLGCIPALIEIEGIRCSHLLGCDDDEVPAKGNFLIDDLISFPAIHELFVFLAFMIKIRSKYRRYSFPRSVSFPGAREGTAPSGRSFLLHSHARKSASVRYSKCGSSAPSHPKDTAGVSR